ncbi:MAG: hypothetical protein DMD83_02650 [Candidatus Rokuibacteriota bacterium]|nr:MAG: hypothetical protein DMD83_02650 [Candidatus Rokubacteria bacterium]
MLLQEAADDRAARGSIPAPHVGHHRQGGQELARRVDELLLAARGEGREPHRRVFRVDDGRAPLLGRAVDEQPGRGQEHEQDQQEQAEPQAHET